MNIRERLQKNHNRTTADAIVRYVAHDPARLEQLMELVLKADQDLAPWAAWPMSYLAETHSQYFVEWVPRLLERLQQPNLHTGLRRNVLRAFEHLDVPEALAARAIDLFFAHITHTGYPPAVTAFAITAAARACAPYPELLAELRLLLTDLARHPQPASITVRIRRVLRPAARPSSARQK